MLPSPFRRLVVPLASAAIASLVCTSAVADNVQATNQTTPTHQTDTHSQWKQIMQQLKADEQRNVGKPLPNGVTALNNAGETVRLVDLMRGPAILIKTMYGCPPCKHLEEFLRKHGPEFAGNHHVQLIVLNVASGDDLTGTKYPRHMPSSIVVLHHSNVGHKGFLGDNGRPSAFLFDKNLKLVARRIGIDQGKPAESILNFNQLDGTANAK